MWEGSNKEKRMAKKGGKRERNATLSKARQDIIIMSESDTVGVLQESVLDAVLLYISVQ